MRQLWKCAVDGCNNLAVKTNVYCGWCAGYSHEMPKDEKLACDKGSRPYNNVPVRKNLVDANRTPIDSN